MAVYYPKAAIRVTATVQMSRTRDALEEVTFVAFPRSVKIDRNEFSKADECTIELDSQAFPLLPRTIRQLLVQVYVGDARSLDDELDDEHLRWIGYIDEPDLALSESDGVIRWKGRDFTGLLLDARRPPQRIVPSYGDNLRDALRRVLDDVPGGENIKLKLQVEGERSRDWPDLADAAPPGLVGEKIAWDPNDTLWRLIERCCDPFGLIPQIQLDTLLVSTSRGADAPPRFPLFTLGANLVEYKERRLLARVREGIALSGYDLSTGSYIVALWPPSGDVAVQKKLKAQRVATGKSGHKKAVKVPATIGATATPVDPNEKRHHFAYGNVADEKTLVEAARAVYEGRARQEFDGSFRCTHFRVPHVSPGEEPREGGPEFDVTRLTSGDRVLVDVLPEHRQLLAARDTTEQRVAFLVDQGYPRGIASTLVRSFESGVGDGIEVYVRSLSMSVSDGDGFMLDVTFQALLAAGGE